MIDIFISRPTWISEEFKDGLDGFLSFLDTHEIKPRTLGSTDYPTESPLDEVISIIEECKGIIVLGYPQIYVTKGKIKEQEKNIFLLPSEWNHIEATLAYMKKMPLLIIHHKGISRGIFEHGAISKFIYEKDLSTVNWFLADDIKGALKKWKSSIKDIKINKTSDISSSRTYSSLTPKFKATPEPPSSEDKLPNDVELVLAFLFSQNDNTTRTKSAIRSKFKCNIQAATYYLEVLLRNNFVKQLDGFYGICYPLTPEGREYVMIHKLVSF